MSFVAVAVGGASAIGGIGGAILTGNAAKDAAAKQAAAAAQANALQKEQYDQTRSDQQPWRDAGTAALSQMSDPSFNKTFNPTDMESVDPGYKFRMQQGQQALERSAAARGGLQSGGTLKAITQYGQNYASNEYQNAYNRFSNDQTNRFNRLSSIAGMGQVATTNTDNLGSNYANNVGQNMIGAANAQGAAGMATAKAWGGALSGISNGMSNNWMGATMMNRMYPQGGGAPSGGATGGIDPSVNAFGQTPGMVGSGMPSVGGGYFNPSGYA